MDIPTKIFKSYDIRGIYPSELNEENISFIAKAFYKFVQQTKQHSNQLTVILGRDMRISSPSLHQKTVQAFLEVGAQIIDIGIVSTPTVYFATNHLHADAGFQISASHNPKEYNGVKMVISQDTGIIKIGKSTGMDQIRDLTLELSQTPVESAATGSIEEYDTTKLLDQEIDNALKIVGNPEVKSFKIAIDPANAMGISYLTELFNKIPAELVKLNFELDGTFPSHQADPLQPQNMVQLQQSVTESGADLGIATDGDGDRCFFVDETGKTIPPSHITALVARELLKKHPGEKVLFDVRYTLTPQTIIKEFGGTPVLTKVGHAFITEKLNKEGGIFGGESSGHYFFRDTGNAESQLPIILTVLTVLSQESKKFSEIIAEISRSFESGEINFHVEDKDAVINEIKAHYPDADLLEIDGVAISYPDRRISLRSSNTEPLLRLNVEALDKDQMEKLRDEVIELIKPHGEIANH